MTAPAPAVFDQVWRGLAKELRSHGLDVKFVEGWKSRGVGDFYPRAMTEHHTGSNRDSGNAPCLGLVTWGTADVGGPLCNILLARDGTIYFVAAGKANHAGIGGPFRGIPENSANTYAIGVEIENDGRGEPYPKRQIEANDILNAVLLERMKRTAYFAFGHKEWTDRKIDPTFDMAAFRKRVRALMKVLGLPQFRVTAKKVVAGKEKSIKVAKRLRKNGWAVTRTKK